MRDRSEPIRRCLVTRRSGSRDRLVRFVLSPDGVVVPDAAEKLPGRGAWIGARRDLVETAVRRGLFAHALRSPALRRQPDLADRTEAALARRLLESLGIARKSGRLVAGFEKTRQRLCGKAVGAVLEAADGAPDGLGRLRSLQPGAPRVGCLTASEIGSLFSRPRTVHAAVEPGGNVASILRDANRLVGFRPERSAAACEDAGFGLS